MINLSVNWAQLLGDQAALAARFQALPSYLAKKHLVASMRKSFTDAKATQVLRKNTPPTNTKRGRKKAGEKRNTGALRKAVTVKAKWIGRNRDGVAVAGIGYRFGSESRKAIWLEFGTDQISPRKFMERTYDQIKGQIAANLSRNLADSLEKAAAELASGRNPGMSRRGMGGGAR